MRTILLAIVLIAFVATPCYTMSQAWDNWVLPNWTPDWAYNGGFVPPNTSSFGFARQVIGVSDPQFIVRYAHYTWVSTQIPGTSFVCGPETYLNSSYLCTRHPLYWNVAVVGPSCKPDTWINGRRTACEASGANNCCYKSVGGDLVNLSRLASVYQIGRASCRERV